MELEVFAGQEKSELSMIEVARAILEQRGRDNEMYFSDLVNDIQTYLGKSDSAIRESLPFFYSDLNTDGSFIPLGENKWGLRSWYAIDEIDEEIITLEEDEDFTEETPSLEYDEENPDDEKSEVESYDSEINEIIPDEDLDEDVEINEEDDEEEEEEEEV
ncbi:TPA: DNA-directed RNA polymerase subunit delta [Streptococcus agalactiae]|nr:DNA-directed RNA polymerase subunit delta [Streptococcus agalactiae]